MNHRRPNPDELTPDDLFRPAGGPTAGYGAPFSEPEAQGASTQYLPPMPAAPQQQGYAPAQPQAGQPQAGQPQAGQPQYGGFPQQQTQSYGQQQGGGYGQGQYEQHGQQGQYEQPVQYQHGGYDDRGDHGDYGYDDDPQRNRPSMRTLTVAVVAGCAVLGIGLGVLLHGGGSPTTQAKGGDKHPGAANHTADKAAQRTQAQALSQLLDTASANRSAVVNAVYSVGQCKALPQAQQTLTQAAQDRANLVTQLGALQVDALPSGTELVAKLTAGWQASQQADLHYAAWAAASADSCGKKHKAAGGGERAAAVAASGNASEAKMAAAELWNKIAAANGLQPKSKDNL